jgi:predicted TIM-barrel fold metal-dependent hydrolase
MAHCPVQKLLSGLLLAFTLQSCSKPQSSPNAKEEVKPQGLLLRDYQPKSMLVTEQHYLEKAKFPVIDNHNHLRDSDPDQCVKAMDATGVVQVVNLDGGWGDRLKENIAKFETKYPGRFLTYALVDWSKIDQPDFGSKAAAQLEADVKAGAHGLKIHKTLGLTIKDKTGKVVPVDDPRVDPIWTKCAELKIPVEIHIGDPAAFFTPLDKFNERYEELEFHPDWLFYPNYPPLKEILQQGENVYARHPETIFIGAHVGSDAENLKEVAARLDRYPNYYVDIDARLSELGRQPYTARKFLIKYQDRVMFGTDTPPDVEAYRLHWRFLETEDEYFDISKSHHFQGRWMVYALTLPDSVLQKLYFKNAMKVIPGAKVK